MSVESIAKIVNINSPSDFLAAVMKGSGRATISKEDVLCALTNHRSKLGQQIMYYWLYEDQKSAAEEMAIAAARGGWLVSTPFMADREFLAQFGRCALSQVMRYQPPHRMIALINHVTEDAVRKNPGKYAVQIEFLFELMRVFNRALTLSKEDFINYFSS